MIKRVLCGLLAAAVAFIASGCQDTHTNTSSGLRPPVGQSEQPAVVARQPATFGTMTMQQVFYQPKQADTVYTVDISRLSQDEVMTLRTLQGYVAQQNSASIYLIGSESDTYWCNYLTAEYGVYFKQSSTEELLILFEHCYNGVQLCSSMSGSSFSQAANDAICGRLLLATPEVYEQYADIFDLKQSSLVSSQSSATSSGQAKDTDQIINRNYIALCDGSSPMLDYVFATGTFCADSHSTLLKLAEEYNRERIGQPTVALLSERPTAEQVKALSGAGCVAVTVGSLCNSTLFSSIKLGQNDYNRQPSTVKLLPGKVYVAVSVRSEGLHTAQQAVTELWSGRNNITRVSTEVDPALCELAPVIVNWLMQNRTVSDGFVAPDCGYAAADAGTMDGDTYIQWQLVNNRMLELCDISVVDDISSESIDSLELSMAGSNVSGYIVESGVCPSGQICKLSNEADTNRTATAIERLDFESVEQLSDWIGTLKPDQTKPLYYSVSIAPNEGGGELYRQIDAIAANANNDGQFNYRFVLIEELMSSYAQLKTE